MPYTPENNPYIPGDPYSYDLKWIVDHIKEALALYQPLHDEVTALSTDFTELHDYVMNYFAQLDLTEEVRAGLDAMAEDGTLDALIEPLLAPIVNSYREEIDASLTAQNAAIGVLESRMDTFASLPEGSTTADAELIDIRVSAVGYTFPHRRRRRTRPGKRIISRTDAIACVHKLTARILCRSRRPAYRHF